MIFESALDEWGMGWWVECDQCTDRNRVPMQDRHTASEWLHRHGWSIDKAGKVCCDKCDKGIRADWAGVTIDDFANAAVATMMGFAEVDCHIPMHRKHWAAKGFDLYTCKCTACSAWHSVRIYDNQTESQLRSRLLHKAVVEHNWRVIKRKGANQFVCDKCAVALGHQVIGIPKMNASADKRESPMERAELKITYDPLPLQPRTTPLKPTARVRAALERGAKVFK